MIDRELEYIDRYLSFCLCPTSEERMKLYVTAYRLIAKKPRKYNEKMTYREIYHTILGV